MALRLPKANTWFQNLTDTDLLTYAQNVHDGLLAAIATFPTPPILPAALQLVIDDYAAALALATGPGAGKINTANKDAMKLVLKDSLRTDCFYVNMIIVGLINGGTDYDAAAVLILSTGYQLSKDPVPAGAMPPVEIVTSGSFTKGQYYILLVKIPNAKGYVVRVINITTGADSYEISFPSTRMTLMNLISGHEYTFQIAAIGSNPTRDFSSQITNVFVI